MTLETLFPEFYVRNTYSDTNLRVVPYNLVKLNDTQFCLELNVAGFDESEINIEVFKNKLQVSAKDGKEEDREYLINHLPKLGFKNTFTLREHIEVLDAKVKNGILTINLELIVPEEKKPKKIMITH